MESRIAQNMMLICTSRVGHACVLCNWPSLCMFDQFQMWNREIRNSMRGYLFSVSLLLRLFKKMYSVYWVCWLIDLCNTYGTLFCQILMNVMAVGSISLEVYENLHVLRERCVFRAHSLLLVLLTKTEWMEEKQVWL